MLVMVLTAAASGCVRDEDANGPVGGSGDGGNVWVSAGGRRGGCDGARGQWSWRNPGLFIPLVSTVHVCFRKTRCVCD